MKRFLPLFLASTTLLLAEEPLNMNAKDKKATGVYKLTTKEKVALQNWIDARYDKRPAPIATDADTKEHGVLTENLNNGRHIRLSDHSLWEIRPSDTPLTQAWITPVEIYVSRSDDPNYPYKLTNSLTGTSVHAKAIQSGKAPEPTVPLAK